MNTFLAGARSKGFYGLPEKGGLSMGHSDALRGIEGVKDAKQYTHAIREGIDRVRSGENADLKNFEMHWRECFVVLKNDTPEERKRVYHEIVTMEDYFDSYVVPENVKDKFLSTLKTPDNSGVKVHFKTQKELDEIDADRKMAHGGSVIGVKEILGELFKMEYINDFSNNPLGTALIIVPCASAAYKMHQRAEKSYEFGAKTVLDFPLAYLSNLTPEERRKMM